MIAASPARAPSRAGAPAVLVVDDNAAKRLAIRAMLAPLGHAIVEADCGRAALGLVLRERFAVILMDVRMPILDGYETAALIRRQSRTPIIFVTAFGCDETETATAYASGGVDFIFTPINRDVLRAKVSAFVDLHAQTQELQASLESITALHAALRDSEVRARAVLHNVADAIVTAGADGLIESLNPSARRLFGYRERDVIGQPLSLVVAPSHHDEFSAAARARRGLHLAKDVPVAATETLGRRKDGSRFAMEIDISPMQIGERTFTIACMRDISARRAYTEALEHRALHDDLTGLPNRTLFGDRITRAIASAGGDGEPLGVFVVNLDEFEEVNETLGRETGNALLQAVAERLRGALRESDTVARIGSDEFGILPAGEADVESAAVIAWKLREALEDPFVVSGHVVNVSASIGIAFCPQHGRETTDLLRRADLAMHEAKRSGRGLAVFAAEPEDRTAQRLTLLSELRDGIGRGELVLHYQPKVDMATRRTTGVEALVRWLHPERGLLMPARFMPEAERSELIHPLTTWVLDEALRQQRAWTDAGLELTMAVNVSARSLALGSDLPDAVARLTATWGIEPGRLLLELTEGAFMDASVPDVLNVLHAMGELLAIDDFGTGHSSLVYLQRLPIDEVKIDRSFVVDLTSAFGDAVIVRSTIDLAHNLGLTVVAEGVEDEATLDMLAGYGCDGAQGYHFSRPRPADELAAWLGTSEFGATVGVGG